MSRKLNALEQKLHQAALTAEDKTLTQKDLNDLSEDASARTAAVNFLLSAGMLKMLKDSKGKLVFRAVGKQELDIKKDLSGEESLVLGHIQASGNEGIWTKHIKARTELHQTVIDRCLKSLTQKQLVKAVKGSVQHPTRKMYMLFHLEPSVEVTGGPWYTDKELDTEFIKLLSAACLKFIKDRSFPRNSGGSSSSQRLLYPISSSPPHPSAVQVQTFLNKSRITETQLSVEHVEMLLGVLIMDGEIEKVPAMGPALWDSGGLDDDKGESDYDKQRRSKRKSDEKRRKKKRRRDDSDSDNDSEDDDGGKKSRKSKKRPRDHSDSDSQSDSEEERRKRKKRKGKKRKVEEDSGSETESDGEPSRRSKKSKSSSKSKRRKKYETESDTATDSESSSSPPPSRARSKSSKTRRSPSPTSTYHLSDVGTTHVYRAIHQEHVVGFGWSQAPCGRCPSFDFCRSGGPVNPNECKYYGEWLGRAEVKVE